MVNHPVEYSRSLNVNDGKRVHRGEYESETGGKEYWIIINVSWSPQSVEKLVSFYSVLDLSLNDGRGLTSVNGHTSTNPCQRNLE